MDFSLLKPGNTVYISTKVDLVDEFFHWKGKKGVILQLTSSSALISISEEEPPLWFYNGEFESLEPLSSDF